MSSTTSSNNVCNFDYIDIDENKFNVSYDSTNYTMPNFDNEIKKLTLNVTESGQTESIESEFYKLFTKLDEKTYKINSNFNDKYSNLIKNIEEYIENNKIKFQEEIDIFVNNSIQIANYNLYEYLSSISKEKEIEESNIYDNEVFCYFNNLSVNDTKIINFNEKKFDLDDSPIQDIFLILFLIFLLISILSAIPVILAMGYENPPPKSKKLYMIWKIIVALCFIFFFAFLLSGVSSQNIKKNEKLDEKYNLLKGMITRHNAFTSGIKLIEIINDIKSSME